MDNLEEIIDTYEIVCGEHIHIFRIREDGLLECTSDGCYVVITQEEFWRIK